MDAENYAIWLRRQGHRVIQTDSCYWYDAQPGFYFYFPYHRLIEPGREELKKILRGRLIFGARYFTPMNSFGKSSYLILCSDKNYDLASVDKKSRGQTRNGLENFDFRQIPIHELISQNHINVDTLIRQGRKPEVWTDEKWKNYCSTMDGLTGFEAWGAFLGAELAAFMVAYQMEDYYTILHHSSVTKYLDKNPNNALVFYVTKLKLSSQDINHVSYGPQSLDAPESLDTFKFRMGFTKYPIKQTIVFHPLIKPFINSALFPIARKIAQFKPDDDFWQKLFGIINFYREST